MWRLLAFMLVGMACTATSKGSFESDIAAERAAIISLYNSAGGTKWINQAGWLSGSDHCTWFGVTCYNSTSAFDGRIQQFSLYGNGLVGTIPVGLSALSVVEYFALSTNQLSGPVPKDLGSTFSEVTYFDLRYNFLSGTVPSAFSNMRSITHFVISNNFFVGDIGFLDSFPSLTYVDVSVNKFSGTVDTFLCTRPELGYCSLVGRYKTNNFELPFPACVASKCIV
jgi:hypothetical protein